MMGRAVPAPDPIAIGSDVHIDRDRAVGFTPHRPQGEVLGAIRKGELNIRLEDDGQVATRESIAQSFDEQRDGAVERAAGQLTADGEPDADMARLHEPADRIGSQLGCRPHGAEPCCRQGLGSGWEDRDLQRTGLRRRDRRRGRVVRLTAMRSIRLGLAMLALGISTVAGPAIMPVGAAGNNRVMNVERGTPLTEHRDSAPRGLTPGRAAGPASPASSAAALASCQGTWSVVPSPNGSGHNDMNAVAAVSANDIWTVGRLSLANGVSQTLSEHWNGNGWSIVASPNTNAGTGDNVLSSVAATATGDAWAVGFARPDQVSARGTLTEHWDGSSWTIAPSPNVLGESNSLFSVKGDAANDYWAVGRSMRNMTASRRCCNLALTPATKNGPGSIATSPSRSALTGTINRRSSLRRPNPKLRKLASSQ